MILIYLLSLWWLLLTGWALLGIGSLDPVSDTVLVMVLLFVSSYLLAGTIASKCNYSFSHINGVSYSSLSKIAVIILGTLFIIQLPVWGAVVKLVAAGESLVDVRGRLYTVEPGEKWEKLLFNYSSALFYNYFLACALVFLHIYKAYRFLLLFCFFLVIAALLKGARGELYQLVGVGVLYGITVHGREGVVRAHKHKIKILCLTVGLIALLSLVSWLRGASVLKAGLDYHTVGFTLLSKYVEGRIGLIDLSNSFGVSFMGGVDYIVGLFARLLVWGELQSYTRAALELQNISTPTYTHETVVAPQTVYYSLTGHNAFYTLLLSAYQSFGVPGSILLGLLFGFVTPYLVNGARAGNIIACFYLVVVISTVFMGVFASALETVGFWLYLVMLNMKFIIVQLLHRRRFDCG